MKTIELSAAMAGASVQENLKNFVGLDTQNALGLMTPERLAAVAGGLEYKKIIYYGLNNKLIKLGKIAQLNTDSNNLFKIISDHGASGISCIAYVSIGYKANDHTIRCSIVNIKGNTEIYYDKNTSDYFVKANMWEYMYIQRIDCKTKFSYEVVDLNPEHHIKLDSLLIINA